MKDIKLTNLELREITGGCISYEAWKKKEARKPYRHNGNPILLNTKEGEGRFNERLLAHM